MTSRRLVVLVFAVCAVGCKHKSEPEKTPASVRGPTFTIPIPDGYHRFLDPEVIKRVKDGVMLMADRRVVPKAFLGSIVVIRANGRDDSSTSEAKCKQTVHQLAQFHVVADSAAMVELRGEKRCQWRAHEPAPSKVHVISTVMARSLKEVWVVTCNYDARDKRAVPACQRVLDQFKFDAM